jgi:hypothetical protein
VVDVVVNAVAAFGPRVTRVVADVDPTDLDAGDHAIGRRWMDTETPDVGFVTVTWSMPLVSRRKVLEPVELVPRIPVIGRHGEMCWMGARIQALTVRTPDDRIHFLSWNVEMFPRLSVVR